tara:strand:+ start:1229 stop:1474 length:246 start_codon:yes stop_codon:yes gene_type:complete
LSEYLNWEKKMQYTISEATNPRYADAENTYINIDVKFYETEDAIHGYTCVANDDSAQCVDYWNRALAGEFGPIAPYVDPDA